MIFQKISEHEQVLFCHEPRSGLRAIIAIHNTTLGPALGGCRMQPYESEEAALEDALRLAKGMTYKCAAADVDFGGGKAVIIGDPRTERTAERFRAFGQMVASLGGRFYTGTDMGTMPEDFIHAAKETSYIVGLPEAYGGSGDSSIPTAQGILYAIQATSHFLWGTEMLKGRHFALQGLGKVGWKVGEHLLAAGANLWVTDVDQGRVDAFLQLATAYAGEVKAVSGAEIYGVDADLFVPCAIGAVINHTSVEQLKVKAVVGSANNQLATSEDGVRLHERGILYAPDYIANSGGLIQVADELYGHNHERVLRKTKAIYETLVSIYQQAEAQGISTMKAADQFCEERLYQRQVRNSFYLEQRRPQWELVK